MTSQNPRDVVMSLYAAHADGDEGSRSQVLDEQIEWWQAEGHPYAASEGPHVGIEAVRKNVVDRLNSEWDRFAIDLQDVVDCGETVVVLGRYHGTYLATGRTLDAQAAVVYTVQNGRIVRLRQYTDTAQFRSVVSPS